MSGIRSLAQNIARSLFVWLRLVGFVDTLDRQMLFLCGKRRDHLAFELQFFVQHFGELIPILHFCGDLKSNSLRYYTCDVR